MLNMCLATAPTATDFWGSDELDSQVVRTNAVDPQLGILSLAAVLEERGAIPQLVDLNALYLRFAEASREPDARGFADAAAATIVASTDAEIYGLGSICSSYPLTIRIAKALKNLRPDSTVLIGGPQASVVDVQTLQAFDFVDFILRGEAERTLPLLLDELSERRAFQNVPSLTYRDNSTVRRNANAPVIEDLDSLPSPAYHLTRYLETAKTADLELGRGCPFACTFCSTNDFFRRNFRLRSPGRVLEDMRAIAAQYAIRDFQLTHDMFTVDKRRVAAFCDAMIASGENFTWSCSARTDCVDHGLLELMARAGCHGIFFGIETGSQRLQKIIDKHLDVQRAEEIIDIAEDLGIRTTVALITGFPEETWDDVRHTMRVFMHSARRAKSDPQLNLLAPLAATPIYSKHKDELVLEELCSDMSHQGRAQNTADLDLIRSHPDIFPNFYLLPIPNLDRNALFELHEFSMMAVTRFRWLLTAIDQHAMELIDFFFEWRAHRLLYRGRPQASQLRQYYRTLEFRADFISFVRAHPSALHPTIAALLEYEDAMSQQQSPVGALGGPALTGADSISSTDLPVPTTNTRVIELSCDLQQIIDALTTRTTSTPANGTHFYATRAISPDKCRLIGISDWLAYLLCACDGTRTVQDVFAYLAAQIPELAETDRDYAFSRLLTGAQSQGFIQIYRSSSSKAATATTRLQAVPAA